MEGGRGLVLVAHEDGARQVDLAQPWVTVLLHHRLENGNGRTKILRAEAGTERRDHVGVLVVAHERLGERRAELVVVDDLGNDAGPDEGDLQPVLRVAPAHVASKCRDEYHGLDSVAHHLGVVDQEADAQEGSHRVAHEHGVVHVVVLEYGRVVAGHLLGVQALAADGGLAVATLVKGDDTVAALHQSGGHDVPAMHVEGVAVGKDHWRSGPDGHRVDAGAVGGGDGLKLTRDRLGVNVGHADTVGPVNAFVTETASLPRTGLVRHQPPHRGHPSTYLSRLRAPQTALIAQIAQIAQMHHPAPTDPNTMRA